jgi:hypothetical protein
MGVGEVADRSRQQASKWLDRTATRLPLSVMARGGSIRRETEPPPGPELEAQRSLDRFLQAGPDRFFAGATDVVASDLVSKIAPGAWQTTLASAESIGRGRFDLLGYEGLSFGDPIDWRLDPVSGKRSPLVHWSAIDPTDAASVGDVKVVWELNRQQFLVTLGVAYRGTGDERHARLFAELFRSWIRENPVGLGINWASSLEVAIRIVSWTWALFLFGRSKSLTPELFAEVRAAVFVHATHIERFLSRHSSPNTHLTGEALGLFYAGVVFSEGKSARRWRTLGRRILEDQIEEQVFPDGVYVEQATAYQIYTIEIYLHYLILAGRNHLTVPPLVGLSVQRMLDVLLALRRPDGGIPAIGDQDGGSLLPLSPRAPTDARGIFATAAGFFDRPDFAWAAERVQPEALWLLGPAVTRTFEARGAAPPTESSRAFTHGGYVVMRSGWQRGAHHLVFDAGPLGCPRTAAHGHADLLSVAVSPFGEPFIVDPGTYAYAADPGFRNYFRGTAAHSTITVDGLSQAEPKGPFGWQQRPSARLHRFASTPSFDLADASHHAYDRLADPVVHRRRVVFVRSPACWLIVDDLSGKLEHRVDHRFQFAPLHVAPASDSWIRASGSRGRGLLMRAFAEPPLAVRIESGSLSPIAGWVSPQYGRRTAAPSVVFSTTGTLPLRILTLLIPIGDSSAPPPRVRLLQDRAGVASGLIFEDTSEAIRFDDDTATVESAPTWKA